MNTSNAFNLIQHSTLISDLNPEECAELSAIADVRDLSDGDILIKQGEADESLYIIGQGSLAVDRLTTAGDTATLHILKSGDLAGELGFVDGTAHSASLRAVGSTVVVRINRQDIESLHETKPKVIYGLMRGIVRTVHRILREMNLQHVELTNYITKTHGRY